MRNNQKVSEKGCIITTDTKEIKNHDNTICNFIENEVESLKETDDFLNYYKSPKST